MRQPEAESPATATTIVELARWRAQERPNKRLFTFLVDGEAEEVHFSYSELDRLARAIAARIQRLAAPGERAVLLYPPGLEFISTFFGCLYAGLISVPAYPLHPARFNRNLPGLRAVVADAQPALVLTTETLMERRELVFAQAPELGRPRWFATGSIKGDAADQWLEPERTGDSLAFLQYTSGSTAAPRGVMLSHRNLLHNQLLMQRTFRHNEQSVFVCWLPPYHDMGLIGNLLQPLFAGATCILLSPLAFLQRPYRWLRAVSRYKATTSGGPNFAYDLCVRKVTDQQRMGLDLRSWVVAFNGAEPVHHHTLEQFATTFGPCGFHPEAFHPCYGLAEATLAVSGGRTPGIPAIRTFNRAALEQNRVTETAEAADGIKVLVSSGQICPDQTIIIVNPETSARCMPNEIGEIWVSSRSVARGYWNRKEETESVFRAYLHGTHEGPFLRTGDLGFLKAGELFITGRLKDLIIIRGSNHYPQDIERTVERSHPSLIPGCGAAFSVEVEGREELVVIHELASDLKSDVGAVMGGIRQAVTEEHDVELYAIVLVRPGNIPKTSSGKIKRYACRTRFMKDNIDSLAAWSRSINRLDRPQHSQIEPVG